MARILDILGLALLALGGAVVAFGHLAVWYAEGFWAMATMLSPWNGINFVMILAALAPGLLLRLAAGKLRARAHRQAQVDAVDPA